MNRGEVVRFFQVLSKHFQEPCQIILTGAGAGAIYGRIRATLDLDFAVKSRTRSSSQKERLWKNFQKAVQETSRRTGIAAQYAEDIDRWSLITLLDYEKHTQAFQRFGKMDVRLLEPNYWAIGKLGRYLDPDIRDLIQVLQKTRSSWKKLACLLGRALRESPRSTALFSFRRQVEDFFTTYGHQIWGKRYSGKAAIHFFHRHAGIKV